ncbi:SDR family oxidoreductase [Myxococcota bacterium]|nr:SDR family oxidoreductase [Myxococcota bacterium]
MKKVFVTGHRGYIGPHLIDVIKQEGWQVTGCDIGLFNDCAWDPVTTPDKEIVKDVRKLTAKDLEGYDCVMHLAALSNDPMGDIDSSLTLDINLDASVRIAKLAKQAGVPRFLFAGSCSVYGAGAKLDLDETAELNPLTAYAKSKIETEKQVAPLADEHFSPAFLRNATAYGYSPNLRIDLVVNNLLGCAIANGEIRIMSDGSPWRPLIHCRDIARAFVAFAKAPKEAIHGKAINVGGNKENYQVRDIGNEVQRLIPGAKITYTGEVGADPRNYRVTFDMLNTLIPDYKLSYNVASGMEELYKKYVDHGFSKKDWDGPQFVRLRTLKGRLDMLKNA